MPLLLEVLLNKIENRIKPYPESKLSFWQVVLKKGLHIKITQCRLVEGNAIT